MNQSYYNNISANKNKHNYTSIPDNNNKIMKQFKILHSNT